MNILLTGGAGFLGSHLAESLLKDGHSVVVMDNLQTGNLKNLDHLYAKYGTLRFINHDVTLPYTLPGKFDWVLNFACPASPPKYQANPLHTLYTSVFGIKNALDFAYSKDGCKVLQASTSEVYGDPFVTPQPETYFGNVNPVGIRSCYDEGKRVAETIMTDYNKKFKVPIRIARIFNTYGPHMDPYDGRVVSNFINQALKELPLTVYGHGLQTRSFCYVSDEIRGFRALMDASDEVNTPVNIGNPYEFSMLELADLVLKLTGSKSKLAYMPLPGDDPTQRRPDITKAKQLLNWEPTVQLEEGLSKTIEYFKTPR